MEAYTEIVRMKFGSHLYGTSTPQSDTDYKGVFIPHPDDILLQEATNTSLNINTKEKSCAKNTSKDTDLEIFTLQGFLRLCDEGQTVAIDMLFAPQTMWLYSDSRWRFIQQYRHKLIHRGASAFAGYCQTQAAKYGIKGSRVSSVRHALEFFKTLDQNAKLNEVINWDEVNNFVIDSQQDKFSGIKKDGSRENFIKFVDHKAPNGNIENFVEINGRKFPMHIKAKQVVETLQMIFDNYGERAKKAESNEGIDWKALSHAVRVCEEAKELLTYGFVSFPRPEAALLLKIKKGEVAYKEVAELIEQGLVDVDAAQAESTLPETIDRDFWRDWLISVYKNQVANPSPFSYVMSASAQESV